MSDPDDFDARLAARFEAEHLQVPADSFVATTMRTVRAERRRRDVMRAGLRVAVLVAVIVASPWLIAGVAHLNAALESSLNWAMGQPGVWALGALAALVVLAKRVRGR
jgi:hypothetical protein